ncbi:MAG: bifunctional [glutamate--ammonia ligase]-adenylyl-L-tyrosine phosphorylase/[glutamate--ammonia-ligase] adenylyltransferase [Pontibacterium sp.]
MSDLSFEALYTTRLEQLNPVWHGHTCFVELTQGSPDALKRWLVASDFAFEQLRNPSAYLQTQLSEAWLNTALNRQSFELALHALVTSHKALEDDAAFNEVLRVFRHAQQLRLIWRELNEQGTLPERLKEASELAQSIIGYSAQWHYTAAVKRWGQPVMEVVDTSASQPQPFLVLAMGKLGAAELNLSSDVDLIFAYPQQGVTQPLEPDSQHSTAGIENQTFFIRLAKKLIQSLAAITAQGQAYRVDMRLRPFGNSGPLVSSFAALDHYFLNQARPWERFAMIKAVVMPCAESADSAYRVAHSQAAQVLQQKILSFVYRQYADYSVFGALRDIKHLINSEVEQGGQAVNVKLSKGGIREVEFIAQVFQLVRGGRDRRYQAPSIYEVMPLLAETPLSATRVAELMEAYGFLRRVEHVLQALADKQTHSLPTEGDAQARLAWVLGFETWQGFEQQLATHRECVRSVFNELMFDTPLGQANHHNESPKGELGTADWIAPLLASDTAGLLALMPSGESATTVELVNGLVGGLPASSLKGLSDEAKERLNRLLPLLFDALLLVPSAPLAPSVNECHERSALALSRILPLVQATLRRSVYLSLLEENAFALQRLVQLANAGPWFCEQLARYPVLLNELLAPFDAQQQLSQTAIQQRLRQQLLRVPEGDEEVLMEALRYYKHAMVLQIAAAESLGELSLMKASDALTWVAEACIEQALNLSWQLLCHKYGNPIDAQGGLCEPRFAIIAYGKLGGLELSYRSDLDLVFVYDEGHQFKTSGSRQLESEVFYLRMGQKIIHLLSRLTPSGSLYEVDMRLRPSGNSGVLVSRFSAFEKYQKNDAWTWEHQALIRARPVAGHQALWQRFSDLRHEILCRPRASDSLKADIRDMRLKMRQHKGENKPGVFHIKHDAGGMVDIEFMSQWGVLAFSEQANHLTNATDNINLLIGLANLEVISYEEEESLRLAYLSYRQKVHELSLLEQSAVVSSDEAEAFAPLREQVGAVWYRIFGAYA